MAIDPKVRAVIDAMEAAFPPLDITVSGTETRRRVKVAGEKVIPAAVEQVAATGDEEIPGPLGPIPVRAYWPAEGHPGPRPMIVFFHGGGWVVCDLDSHDGICRSLANASGCIVVAVDYRLAPEHSFPIGVEDCYAATLWLAQHASHFGATPGQLAVAGDSAGGNLTAAVTLMARDRSGPRIAFQVLVYPVTDYSDDTESHRNTGEGYFLKSAEVMYYWGEYLADPADGAHPYASPLRAPDLRDLPPALVITAEFDPLRDEGEAYGAALRGAGVPVVVHRYDGMFHSFLSFLSVLDAASTAMAEIGSALRQAFALPAEPGRSPAPEESVPEESVPEESASG